MVARSSSACLLALALASSSEALVVGGTPRATSRRVAVPVTASILDDIVKGASDWFGEQEKGFGILTYSEDKRTARASHILFSFDAYPEDATPNGEAMAKALKAKIESEEYTFEFVAEKFSACSSAEQGGDLGTFKRGAMVPEFDKAVFEVDEAVPIGTLQGPIKTKFGYHLIKVVERDDADA